MRGEVVAVEGGYVMAQTDWIQTYGGEKFYPLAARPEEVKITDIARALSMLCRYCGHVARFYSVAEHCVRVSRMAADRVTTQHPAIPSRTHQREWLNVARWGLLHDASEAYLGDVTRPVKKSQTMAGYKAAETRLMGVIAERFALEGDEPTEVRWADDAIYGLEVPQLKAPVHPEWKVNTPSGKLEVRPIQGERIGWAPARAEREFLKRFDLLWGKEYRE